MKIRNFVLLIFGASLILSSCSKSFDGNAKISSTQDTLSYALGVDVGNSLKNNLMLKEINYDLFMQGISSALEEKETKMDEEEIKKFLQLYIKKAREEQAKEMEEKATKNLEEGIAFLEENKEKEGIIVTESGLQYEIIEEGNGKSPSKTDIVRCKYIGTLIDGTEFDKTPEGDTSEFGLNRVIRGWTEGLQLMKEGAKYRFYIPTELAYGKRVRPGGKLEANMALIFDVELYEVKPPVKKDK